jgi:uncharacterized protein (TIGR03118 family)
MLRSVRRTIVPTSCIAVLLMFSASMALAQYQLTNLSSNQAGQAHHDDPLLANAWGMARGATGPWWVSDNTSGWSTLYNAQGVAQGLRVLIPTTGDGPDTASGLNGPGTPTGIVVNSSSNFQVQGWPALFLFDTLDGTISGWAFKSNANQAIIGVDNGKAGAVYTGLAINSAQNMIYAANMAAGTVEVYDGNFNPVTTPGAFTDPSIPTGFAPFGIQDLNGEVYVTYAATNGGPGGFVDKYTETGVLVNGKSLLSGAPLNQPWGVALAPKNFGALSNTILVSNNTNSGTINAFNDDSMFVGTLKDSSGKAIVINQLWAIGFGGGNSNSGATNDLYFTAGPANNNAGTIGVISPVSTTAPSSSTK